MSSEEDFSLVLSENALEDVKSSITKYKKKYEQLLQEQKELAACRDDQREMAKQFKQRTEKLTQAMEDDQRSYQQGIENQMAQRTLLLQQETQIKEEINRVKAALEEEQARNSHLKQQTDVFTAVPERKVFFNGLTQKATNRPTFEMKSHIEYLMDEGTALITFEEKEVARKILDLRNHQVDLGEECRIAVEARPVQLMMPKRVEIDSEVCPRRILISDLPMMDAESLRNKLEIHFSKSKNGGGEVEDCEMMPDSWTVVLTFLKEGIVRGLTEKEYHEVGLQKKKHKVRVTPFLNGSITKLKPEMMSCPRTVLLTGIPDVMEPETMQDLLEIYFQKSTNGGGEIEAFLYNPMGQHATAVFESASQNGDK